MEYRLAATSARPHDLVRFDGHARTLLPTDAPSWARRASRETGWAVVRRAESPPGTLPVGLRGRTRSQRFAFTLDIAAAIDVVTPEDLTERIDGSRRDVPALAALHTCRDRLAEIGGRWGPTGSVGFELATGIPTATAASDLDVLVRAPELSTPAWVRRLSNVFDTLAVRVDCQVDTPLGAVALIEMSGETTDILVRTPIGPRIARLTEVLS